MPMLEYTVLHILVQITAGSFIKFDSENSAPQVCVHFTATAVKLSSFWKQSFHNMPQFSSTFRNSRMKTVVGNWQNSGARKSSLMWKSQSRRIHGQQTEILMDYDTLIILIHVSRVYYKQMSHSLTVAKNINMSGIIKWNVTVNWEWGVFLTLS